MKRYGNLFDRVVAFDNLLSAAHKTMLGQKRRPTVARFYFHLETELFALEEELRTGDYRPLPYRVFEIREPKRRLICAADIRDRVVHHAVCNLLEPIFERRAIYDSFACRKGKGSHAAVRRAQEFARRSQYYLQCDISKYFPSVDHEVLKQLLRRMVKDRPLLELLDLIIDQPLPDAPPGKGMPIGNLTSQHFANLYLGELDHFVKERLRVKGYIRYMDDFLLFGEDKRVLHEHLATIRSFVSDRLRLTLKDRATVVAPVSQGISFLGFRVWRGRIGLRREKWVRFSRRIREREAAYLAGEITEQELIRGVSSMVGHVIHADTLKARRELFAESLRLG